MMRAAIIVNPAKSDVADLREQVDKTLTAAGWSPSLWLETTPEDPGHGMAEAAVEAGVQLVVICGGDGTVMACLGTLGRHRTCPSRSFRSAAATCSPATWACRSSSKMHSRSPSTVSTVASTAAGSTTSRSR